MKKQMIWGLATLILLLGIAAVFLLNKDTATKPNHVLEQETKNLTNKPIPQPKTDVSIAETDKLQPSEKAETSHVHEYSTVHQGTHASQASMQQTQSADTASEEVIYPHHELLQTHPVEALRAQAKDNGHWSVEYIPPFPPDDVEANELARAHYVRNYYYTHKDYNHPIAVKAQLFITKWNVDSWEPYPRSARVNDLSRFNWTSADRSMFGDDYFENLYPKRRTTFTQEDFDRANNK